MALTPPAISPPAADFDPRPVVRALPDGDRVIAGRRCSSCGHALACRVAACSRCGGQVEPAEFGPVGEIWAVTTVHISTPGRDAPYTLAYVDLHDGPRILAHVRGAGVTVGEQVWLTPSASGDPTVAGR